MSARPDLPALFRAGIMLAGPARPRGEADRARIARTVRA
jgi:hypothetical protein